MGGVVVKRQSLNKIKEIMDDSKLIDIWRERTCKEKKQFTWSQKTPRIRCRLDYFLIHRKF